MMVADCLLLLPLTLHSYRVHFDVEHDEPPQLVELEVHPELFRVREFFLCVHGTLLLGDQFPAEVGFELPDESLVKHKLHPGAA